MIALLKRFYAEEAGQGIAEYAAILGFVAIFAAVTFALVNGSLEGAVSSAFSEVSSSLNNLVVAAS